MKVLFNISNYKNGDVLSQGLVKNHTFSWFYCHSAIRKFLCPTSHIKLNTFSHCRILKVKILRLRKIRRCQYHCHHQQLKGQPTLVIYYRQFPRQVSVFSLTNFLSPVVGFKVDLYCAVNDFFFFLDIPQAVIAVNNQRVVECRIWCIDKRLSDRMFVRTLNVRSTVELEPEIQIARLASLQRLGNSSRRMESTDFHKHFGSGNLG